MNETRRYRSCISAHADIRVEGTGPSWLYIVAVRRWLPPVFDRSVDFGGIDEPKSPRRAHEPYEWMKRIRTDR
jgi:hypothetical protein